LLTTYIIFSHASSEERESLKFKLAASSDYKTLASLKDSRAVDDLGSWGHEFVRSLAGEIGQEYTARTLKGADPDDDEPFKDLLSMVDVIVPFHVAHHAEAEAIDLLIEVQRLKKILELKEGEGIDEKNYKRVCLYLVKTADFMSDPDDYAVSEGACVFFFVSGPRPLSSSIQIIAIRKFWKQPMSFSSNKTNTMMRFA
jgi:hypothetical protein